MKTKKIAIERLNKFGRFIGKNYLQHALIHKEIEFSCIKGKSGIEHFEWAFALLPKFTSGK